MEVANFDVRKPIRTNNCINFKQVIDHKLAIAFSLFNISQSLKSTIESDGKKCRFTRCVAAIRTALCRQVQQNMHVIIDELYLKRLSIQIGRNQAPTFTRSITNNIRSISEYIKRRGRRKSVNTIIAKNESSPT